MGFWAALVLFGAVVQDGTVDDAKIRQLIEQLRADFLEDRQAARKALEEAGKKAEGRLIEALAVNDHRVRRECLELLMGLKSSAALAPAVSLFRTDEDLGVQDAAFRLFQALGKDAEGPLIAALDSPVQEFRRQAIRSLTEFRSEKCADKMWELFEQDSDRGIKDAAFRCLLSVGKTAEKYLVKCLANPDAPIRRDALEGLKKSGGDEVLAAVGKLYGQESDAAVIQRAYEYLETAGARAEPHLLSGLRSGQEQTRRHSIEGLRKLKSEKALEPVAELFRSDASESVRGESAELLKDFGLKAERALLRGLESKEVGVRRLAMQALGEIGSDTPLEEIGRIFREDKNKEIHATAFDYLKSLGIKAEKHLLVALADEDKEIRRKAVLALGDAKSEAAIERLIDFMTELDPVMKSASEDALVRIGPKAIDSVDRAVTAGRLKKRTAETILALYYQEEVERLLDALVTDSGGSGFFEGQFQPLLAFGKEKALPVLLRMVGDAGYGFRRVDRRGGISHYDVKMRELAVLALGEFGGERVIETLREALRGTAFLKSSESIYDELLITLHRLGDKKPLEEFVQKARAEADAALGDPNKDESYAVLFSLGMILNRVGRRKEASETYQKFIQAVEQGPKRASDTDLLPTALYNLSCLSSLEGDAPRAVEWLRKAVRAGFIDRAWIRMDKELDPIRNDEGFRKLLEDDSLFEKKSEN